MKKIVLIVEVISLFFFTSCKDFLEEYPKDLVYPTSIADFNELLNGEGYMNVATGTDIGRWIHFMDDDILHVSTSEQRPNNYEFYEWAPYLETGSSWISFYHRISILNIVIEGITDFEDDSDDYRRVKGEAHFLRAAYYYFLVNIYGKPYHKDRATTDLGVPLKTTAKIEDKAYSRHTVKECYDLIISDLNLAVSYLKGLTPANNYRANEASSRILLSRVYLYTGDWEKVVNQCDSVFMNRTYRLLDFNTITLSSTVYAIGLNSPETIFSNGGNVFSTAYATPPAASTYNTYAFAATYDLLDSYETGDLRRRYFYRNAAASGTQRMPRKMNINDGSDFFMIRLPEAYLNKAEALAVLGGNAQAVSAIEEVRNHRFTTGTTLPIGNLSGEELMNKVREERRKELSFEGHRWFDLRRFAVHPVWPFQKEILHNYYNGAELKGSLVLGKYDDTPEHYVLPIPSAEVVVSGGVLQQNEVRRDNLPILAL